MTTLPVVLLTVAYALDLVAAVYFTRATSRRAAGALAGGVAVGAMAMGMIALCEAIGWWRVPLASEPYLLFAGFVISCSPIYLVTWRVARRFGWRGLAVFLGAATVIGPPRDYWIAAKFPEWMVFSPGVLPILADAVAYAGIVVVGHCVMRLVAGPSGSDRLARSATPNTECVTQLSGGSISLLRASASPRESSDFVGNQAPKLRCRDRERGAAFPFTRRPFFTHDYFFRSLAMS